MQLLWEGVILNIAIAVGGVLLNLAIAVGGVLLNIPIAVGGVLLKHCSCWAYLGGGSVAVGRGIVCPLF